MIFIIPNWIEYINILIAYNSFSAGKTNLVENRNFITIFLFKITSILTLKTIIFYRMPTFVSL